MNGEHLAARAGSSSLAARIASFELAFNMQRHAPEAVDLSRESEATKELYGVGKPRTDDFGRKCLLARRLVERGVRFVQLYSGGGHNDDNWDAHSDIVKNHEFHAGNTDQPVAGLLKEPSTLKARAATTTPTASPCGSPAAVSRAASRWEQPTSSARPRWSIPFT
jgi:hypothetical protein